MYLASSVKHFSAAEPLNTSAVGADLGAMSLETGAAKVHRMYLSLDALSLETGTARVRFRWKNVVDKAMKMKRRREDADLQRLLCGTAKETFGKQNEDGPIERWARMFKKAMRLIFKRRCLLHLGKHLSNFSSLN